MGYQDEHEDDYDDDEERECFICGGEGYLEGSEFEDPLWYDEDESYRCYSCLGTGLRKDMIVM